MGVSDAHGRTQRAGPNGSQLHALERSVLEVDGAVAERRHEGAAVAALEAAVEVGEDFRGRPVLVGELLVLLHDDAQLLRVLHAKLLSLFFRVQVERALKMERRVCVCVRMRAPHQRPPRD